jgi:hypothetical protein
MNANEKLLVTVGQVLRSAMVPEPDGEVARAAFDALVLALAEGKEVIKLSDSQIRILRSMTRAREDRLPSSTATALGLDKTTTYADACFWALRAAKSLDREFESLLEMAEEAQRTLVAV